MRSIIISVICFTLAAGCDSFGPDEKHALTRSSHYVFQEGDQLVYQSDLNAVTFDVLKVVKGEYSDSRSGTCGKPRFDIYQYQAIYLIPHDSVVRSYYFVDSKSDDCGGHPRLSNTPLVASLNSAYTSGSIDEIAWLNELYTRVEEFDLYHEKIELRNKLFENVYAFHILPYGKFSAVYYTRKYGVVAFRMTDGTLYTLQF